ncbi:MAG TPA: LysE family translocator [Methylomirabilota bacterium]|nr:LysE family translocator [Methylomirabilota bacterium]
MIVPEASVLGVFVVAAVVLLLTPGPAVLYIVTRSVEQGRLAGLVSALGVHAGTLVHVAAAALGVSALLVSSAVAFDVVKYLGALYLIYLGIRKLLGWDQGAEGRAPGPRSLRRLFGQGVVVNVLNPKTALFFLAFLPQFVDVSKGAVGVQILTLGLIFVALGVVSDGLYALAAGTAGDWLKRDGRLLRAERYVSGGVFVGLGLTAALAGNGRK